MQRQDLLDRVDHYFSTDGLAIDLARRVAYRSESDTGQSPEALLNYLEKEMQPWLQAQGFVCEVLPNPVANAGPLLLARRIEDSALPTMLSYGHGDVVSGQEGAWREGLTPWELRIEGDHWYGRGTADNKGQHTVTLAALAHTLTARKTQGRGLGYNVTLLIETGEEAGSPGLRTICETYRDALRADVFVASDGPRISAASPTLFLGSRGAVNFSLSVRSRERAYHSGNWGGVLANPATVLSHAIATLVNAQGRILVPGLLPPPMPQKLRQALRTVDVGADPDAPQISHGWGEPGLRPIEQLVGWNTLEVLAIGSGNPSRPVNAIPPPSGGPLPAALCGGHRLAEPGPHRTHAPGCTRLRHGGSGGRHVLRCHAPRPGQPLGGLDTVVHAGKLRQSAHATAQPCGLPAQRLVCRCLGPTHTMDSALLPRVRAARP